MKKLVALLLALALPLLLPGCGTKFYAFPNSVGVQMPCTETPNGNFLPWFQNDEVMRHDAEIYRIGADYYAKITFPYFPCKQPASFTWVLLQDAEPVRVDCSKPAYVCSTYFKLDDRERRGLDLPALPAGPADSTPLPATLTDREAAKFHPVPIGAESGIWRPGSCRPEPRYTWGHYATMPATAVALVGVDVPCTIVGSIFGLLGYAFYEML